MYEGLKSEPSATEEAAATTLTGGTSKSPPIIKSRKRKET